MRALVTGASGFLGRHLCAELRQRGDFVVELWRDSNDSKPNPFDITKALGPNLVMIFGSFNQVERVIAEYELDTVFHLAAQTQVSTAVAHPVNTFEANIEGTWKVLEACRRQKVKRVIVASSDKCYGDGQTPYVEDQDLRPNGVYATSKACADMIAQTYQREYHMSVAVTRCGNLYGPGHTNWSTLIPGTIRSVLRGERPVLRSNGGPKRDFLFVEDAVDGYIKLALSEQVGAYNFGTGKGTSALEVVGIILRLMGSELMPIIEARTDGPVEIDNQVLDCTRALAIGWEPRHQLSTGLLKTIEWYRQHYRVVTIPPTKSEFLTFADYEAYRKDNEKA